MELVTETTETTATQMPPLSAQMLGILEVPTGV